VLLLNEALDYENAARKAAVKPETDDAPDPGVAAALASARGRR